MSFADITAPVEDIQPGARIRIGDHWQRVDRVVNNPETRTVTLWAGMPGAEPIAMTYGYGVTFKERVAV